MATNTNTSFGYRSYPNTGSESIQQSWGTNSYQQQPLPLLPQSGSRVVSDRLANNPYRGQPADGDSLCAPDTPVFDRPEVQYIEVERPVITEKIVPKEIYEEVYVNVPTVKEVIVPVYVPVSQEEYVEVIEMLPPPLEDIPAEYRKIIGEGAVKLGLFLMENKRLNEKLNMLKSVKEHEIAELRKKGIVYDKAKNRRYKHLRAKREQEHQQTTRSPSTRAVHLDRPKLLERNYSAPQQPQQNWIERKITEFELIQEPVPIPDIPPTSQVLFHPTLVNILPYMSEDLINRAARSDSPPRDPKDPNRPQLEQKVSSLMPWVKRVQRKDPYVEYPPPKQQEPAPKAIQPVHQTTSVRSSHPSLPAAVMPVVKTPTQQPSAGIQTLTPSQTVGWTTGRSAQPMQVHGVSSTGVEWGPVKIQSNSTIQLPPGAKVVSDYYTTSNTPLTAVPLSSGHYTSSVASRDNVHFSFPSTQAASGYSANGYSSPGATRQPTSVGGGYVHNSGSAYTSGAYKPANIGDYSASRSTPQRLDTGMKVYNMDTNSDYKPVKIESGRSVSPVGSRALFEKLSSPIKYAAEHDTTVFRYNPLPVSTSTSTTNMVSSALPKSAAVGTTNQSRLGVITEMSVEQQSNISNAPTKGRNGVATSNLQVHTSTYSAGSNGLRRSGYQEQEADHFGRAPNFMETSEDGLSMHEQQVPENPFESSSMRNPPSFGMRSKMPAAASPQEELLLRSEISDENGQERSVSRSSVTKTTKKSSLVKNKPSITQSQFDI